MSASTRAAPAPRVWQHRSEMLRVSGDMGARGACRGREQVSALWGSNLWSGYKFHLAGPNSRGINYTAPDYPTTQYDEDPHLGSSLRRTLALF
eukprot:620747-Rhodomonas_salina.2